MSKKYAAVLYRSSENYEVAVEAMAYLRKQFLKMPFEEFVNVKKLRCTLPEKETVKKHLTGISTYLDFGTESYRYFMQYLEDTKTDEIAEADISHDIHTDMWGRIRNRNAKQALGFAMGFQCFSKDLGVEDLGYERDPGYVEETVSTELGDVQISGLKNINGNFHGYCEIVQGDGTLQNCFFDDGKILARRIDYTNGMCEDVQDNNCLAVDIWAPRTVYEYCERQYVLDDDSIVLKDDDRVIRKVTVDRETVEEIYHTLGKYELQMEYQHYVEYPYDEGGWETEKAKRVPGMSMALLIEGKLVGVLFKTNGYHLLALDAVKGSVRNSYRICVAYLDEEYTEGVFKFSLKQKSEE